MGRSPKCVPSVFPTPGTHPESVPVPPKGERTQGTWTSPGNAERREHTSGTQTKANVHGGSRDPNRGSWCTPKWLADLIGPFDLDPCSNPRSHVQATRTYQLERGQDGLFAPGSELVTERVFINPPYEHDSVLRWFGAYKHTRFCFLLRFDPSTEWFDKLYEASELIAIPRGRRVNFEPPPGVQASSNAYPHALFYRHAEDATDAVVRACVAWRKKSRG